MGYTLLGPVLAQVGLSLLMWVVMYVRRLPALLAADPSDDELQDKATLLKLPAPARFAAENYNHQFEMPVLFYVLCLAATFMKLGGEALVLCAWTYVALRVVHSIIHVTYNKVKHRFAVFALSGIVLIIMFVIVASAYWS